MQEIHLVNLSPVIAACDIQKYIYILLFLIHSLIHSLSGPNAIASASSVSTLSALSTIALSLTARTSLWQNTARAADFRPHVLPWEETLRKVTQTDDENPFIQTRGPTWTIIVGWREKDWKKNGCVWFASQFKRDWRLMGLNLMLPKQLKKKQIEEIMSHASFVCTTYLAFSFFLFDPVGLSVPITVRRVCRNCFRCMSCRPTMFCKRMQVSET